MARTQDLGAHTVRKEAVSDRAGESKGEETDLVLGILEVRLSDTGEAVRGKTRPLTFGLPGALARDVVASGPTAPTATEGS